MPKLRTAIENGEGILDKHRVKRVFIPITDIESENPEDIEVYEFEGQNFKLIAK